LKLAILTLGGLVVELLAPYALDRIGLIERLLSPGAIGLGLLAALLAGCALFALRLGLLFIAPGLLLARALESIAERSRR
jgi:hypothetical protein